MINVGEEDAKKNMQFLTKKYGIFAGMSSGGALFAALEISKIIDKGNIVFIVCDRGDRYLSTDFYD